MIKDDDVRMFDAQTERVETGPIQFGDDWPGVFIRGDHALYFAMMLEGILQKQNSTDNNIVVFNTAILKGLVNTLKSCQVSPPDKT